MSARHTLAFPEEIPILQTCLCLCGTEGFGIWLLKTFCHGPTGMDESGNFPDGWLRTNATIGEKAIADRMCSASGTTVVAKVTAPSCQTPHPVGIEDGRVTTLHRSRHERVRRQGTGGQVGETFGG